MSLVCPTEGCSNYDRPRQPSSPTMRADGHCWFCGTRMVSAGEPRFDDEPTPRKRHELDNPRDVAVEGRTW